MSTVTKPKPKPKTKSPSDPSNNPKDELWAIPENLDSDLMALITNANQWHQMQVQPKGYDPLSIEAMSKVSRAFKIRLDALKSASSSAAKPSSAAGAGKGKKARGKGGDKDPNAFVAVVRSYTLAKPSFLPINNAPVGSKSIDPTQSLVQKLDLSADSNILAAGIEWLVLPAYGQWREQAKTYLTSLEAQSLQSQQVSRQSMSPKTGGGGGGGGGFKIGGFGGGGGGGAGKAADARRKKKEADRAADLVEDKMNEWGEGFMVFPSVWVVGKLKAARNRHALIEKELERYANDRAGGNRFVPTGSDVTILEGDDLSKLPQVIRRYPFLMPGPKTVEPNVLTSTELAALWHIPNDKFQAPGLKRAGAQSPPPSGPLISRSILPDGQQLTNNPEWRRIYGRYLMPDGTIYELGLNEKSVLKHTDCVGRPGSGKTVYIESCVIQDMLRSDDANVSKGGSPHPWNSVVISDPNGDLIYDTVDRLPETHELLTCIVDPLDEERIVGINPLQVPTLRPRMEYSDEVGEWDNLFDSLIPNFTLPNIPLDNSGSGKNGLNRQSMPINPDLQRVLADASQEYRKYGADGMIAASMQEIFAKTMGVSMDTTPTIFRVLQNVILLAVRSSNNATFKTLYRLVTNESYRQACLSSLAYIDEISQVFWTEEFPQLAEKQGGAALMPTKSRLEGLLRKDHIALMFGQPYSTVNIRRMIDSGSNLFFRFSPALSGDKPFMLAVTFNLIKQAVFSRSDIPKEQRRLVSVYLDEFQEMVGADSKTLEIWLEQARKFGGAVFLAHQNLDQVEKVLKSMKGTVSNWVAMSIGPGDRPFFGDFFQRDEWPYDQILNAFATLPAFAAVAQFQYNGTDYTPVLLQSLERTNRPDSMIPAVISRSVPITEQTPRGYEVIPLEHYLKRERLNLKDLIQISSREGYEGFWESTPTAAKRQLRPINCFDQPQLIEELTQYLWRNKKFGWAVHPGRNIEAFKAAELDIDHYKTDPSKVRQLQKWLMEIERITPENATRQKYFEQMEEAEWQLYRAVRYHRDRQLVNYIARNPSVLPEKRSRVITLSRLQYAIPIPEAKAEQVRPDKFVLMAQRGDFGGEMAEMVDEFAA